jgi:hypothetical protein
MTVPGNTWFEIEMTAELGKSDTTWTARIELPEGTVRTFRNLRCDSDWKEARWIGFVSVGANDSVFYLDDVGFELE